MFGLTFRSVLLKTFRELVKSSCSTFCETKGLLRAAGSGVAQNKDSALTRGTRSSQLRESKLKGSSIDTSVLRPKSSTLKQRVSVY